MYIQCICVCALIYYFANNRSATEICNTSSRTHNTRISCSQPGDRISGHLYPIRSVEPNTYGLFSIYWLCKRIYKIIHNWVQIQVGNVICIYLISVIVEFMTVMRLKWKLLCIFVCTLPVFASSHITFHFSIKRFSMMVTSIIFVIALLKWTIYNVEQSEIQVKPCNSTHLYAHLAGQCKSQKRLSYRKISRWNPIHQFSAAETRLTQFCSARHPQLHFILEHL